METTSKTILYVDDDPDDLAMFRLAVESLGSNYHIVEAFDGVHALVLLREMEQTGALPSLIVLDMNMPRMDGKQTLVAIQKKSTFASTPIVLYSTSSSPLDKIFSETKNVEFITKPFRFETLLQVVHKMLMDYRL